MVLLPLEPLKINFFGESLFTEDNLLYHSPTSQYFNNMVPGYSSKNARNTGTGAGEEGKEA